MAVVGELIVLMGANNAPLLAGLATSEAAVKGFSATTATHTGVLGTGFGAVGLAALGMGAAVVAGGALAVGAAASFQEQMATINTIAHQTPEELAKTGEAIRGLAVSSGTSLPDLTKGFYDLLSAGVSTGDAMAILTQSNTLAIGGLATTAQTVDLLTTAINSYGLDTAGAATATDQFALAVQDGKVTAAEIGATFAQVAPLAASAGIGIDQIATSYAVLTARGVPASDAMTQMTRAMVELQKPSADLAALQEKLGVNFADVAREQGLVPALEQMRAAAEANGVPFQNLFGRLEGLNFALATTGPNFATYSAELTKMHSANGTAAAQAAERMGTFDRSTDKLGASLNNLLITVGTPLLPFLTNLVNGVTAVVGAITGFVGGLGSAGGALSIVQTVIATVVGWFTTFLQHVTGSKTPVADLGAGLTALGGVIGTIVTAFATVVGAVIGALDKFGVFKFLGDAVSLTFGILGDAVRALISPITTVATYIGDNLGKAFQAVQFIIDNVAGAIKAATDAIGGLIDGAKKAVDAVASIPGVKLGGDVAGGVGGLLSGIKLPGFASGGTVPGTGPQLAIGHGGEHITPAGQAGGGQTALTHTTVVQLDGQTIGQVVERLLFNSASGFSSGFAGSSVTD